MPTELVSQTWLFDESLANTIDVFGGRDEEERWMSQAAVGLDGARAIDLIRTVRGAELVNEFGPARARVYN